MAKRGNRPVCRELAVVGKAAAHGAFPSLTAWSCRDGLTFVGWGRAGTDRAGRYSVDVVKPDAISSDSGPLSASTARVGPQLRRTLVGAPDGQGFRFDVRL